MSLIKNLVLFSFKLTLIVSLILFSITLLPDQFFGDLKFEPQPKQFYGSNLPSNVRIIQPNLNEIKKLELDHQVNEPESLKFHNGFIYVGVVNGQILRIDEKTKKVSVLTTLVDKEAKNCINNKIAKESCGRALDIDIAGNTLYVVDTYHGFIEYDLIKNTKITYDLSNKIPGYETNDITFNSIRQDPTNTNLIYLSLSSTKYGYDGISKIFLELESSGKLIAFNKLIKKVSVLADGLTLANGIEITDNKQSILINDLCNQRILKFDLKQIANHLQTSKTNLLKPTVFKDQIPGLPDNLTKHKNHLFAALFFYIPDNNLLIDQITSNVHFRKLIFRLLYLSSETLKLIRKYYTCNCLDKLQYNLESGKVLQSLPYKSAVAVLDQNTGQYSTIILLPLQYITHAIYESTSNSLYFGSIALEGIHKMSFKL